MKLLLVFLVAALTGCFGADDCIEMWRLARGDIPMEFAAAERCCEEVNSHDKGCLGAIWELNQELKGADDD